MKKNRVDEFIKNPKKALLTLAFPMLIGMLFQVLYNVVDTAFVGRLGAESIAALTFSFPLFFILIAINAGVGTGMSSVIARYLGAKKKKAAENAAMHGLYICIFFAFVVLILGLVSLRPLFILFGASGNVLELAMGYMTFVLFAIFFMFITFILNSIFSAQGDPKTPMKIQVFALVLNIILDPIFIYYFGFGVKGAGIATLIAFFIGFLLFVYYTWKKSYLRIHFDSFKLDFSIIKEIFTIGAPASVMMLLMSFYTIFVNRFMAHFGTDHIAALGISFRLESVSYMPIIALSMALLTLVGMFYGAKEFKLLKEVIFYGIKIGVVFSSLMGLILFLFPSFFLRIFTPDIVLLSLGSGYLRIIVLMFPLMAVSMIVSRVIQAMGYGLPGLVINLIRFLIVPMPLAYLFVFVLGYGYLSVAVAMVIGSLVAAVISLVLLRVELRKVSG
ncbi:MATE family efflux transporter [Candidatus Woesearchaeota archaeon]|nr:MATE family efflux transporter [Candidatus Woesearchaeota archaeon]